LASNIASAQDSESVAKAIEDFADPVGSFKWKRNENWKCYFSINGYMGGAYGSEELSDDAFNEGNHFSVFAPVGLEFGIATGIWFPSTIGIFGSVIDVGTLASYRLSETISAEGDTVSNNPQVKFKNIIAPGIFLVFGISKTFPITLGLGYQYAPSLRSIENTDEIVNALRFSSFLAIDLNILKF